MTMSLGLIFECIWERHWNSIYRILLFLLLPPMRLPRCESCEIGRAHVWTPVTSTSRMPSSAWKKKRYESNLCNCLYRSLQKVRTLRGFECMALWQRCDGPTNWAMKPLTLGAGHLLVLRSPWGMNLKLYVKYFKYWTADVKSSKLWSSQLWKQFMQLHI